MLEIEIHRNTLGWAILGADDHIIRYWTVENKWGGRDPAYFESLSDAKAKAVSIILVGEAKMGRVMAALFV